MTVEQLITSLFMTAWFSFNGFIIFVILAVLNLDAYSAGAKIAAFLAILFAASLGNLLALTFLYPN